MNQNPIESQQRMDSRKYDSLPRAVKRHIAHRPGIMQVPGSARVRSGIRTGTTKHFRLWMADLKLKSTLQKTSTAALADHTGVPSLASSAFALMYIAGIRNVYDLTQISIERLLGINGIGLKKAEAVEEYLLRHSVKPSWTATD
jgi:hypothetical protein